MIANRASRDAVGNAYAGFSDATTLNFSTGDSKAPSVRDISSTMTNSTFGTGAQISITLRFSEVVNVNFAGRGGSSPNQYVGWRPDRSARHQPHWPGWRH